MWFLHRLGNALPMHLGYYGLECGLPRRELPTPVLPVVQAQTGESQNAALLSVLPLV